MLSDGQGEMKGQILRIAHIGYLDYLDCIAIIAGLEQVLAQLKPESFQFGDGLRAAQLVYAEARQNGEEAVKIVVAEKIAGAAMKVLEAIPNCTVVTPEQFALDPALAVSDADALIVRSAVQADAALIEAGKKHSRHRPRRSWRGQHRCRGRHPPRHRGDERARRQRRFGRRTHARPDARHGAPYLRAPTRPPAPASGTRRVCRAPSWPARRSASSAWAGSARRPRCEPAPSA